MAIGVHVPCAAKPLEHTISTVCLTSILLLWATEVNQERLFVVVWWLIQNGDELMPTECGQEPRMRIGELCGQTPPSGEFAGHDDLADALFAAELAQQLLGGLQPGAAVAQFYRKRLGEQEVKQRRIADAADL